ncbi:hypothetical protein [uncultured Devosia sp.]|uniref:hypothetical protein n=1 Tax=uncultured Devosia sp. TaxID=211434 RepID=UPI0035CB553E
MNKIIVSSLVVLGLSGAAFAQTPSTFADVDADTSGELSFAELQAVWPDLSEDEFNTADVDVSAGLSTTELGALQPAAAPAAPAEGMAPDSGMAPATPDTTEPATPGSLSD